MKSGMTQEELGEILGVTKGAIQKYESGQIKNFKIDTIKVLSELFEIPPAYFIYDQPPIHTKKKAIEESLIDVFGSSFINLFHNMKGLNEMGKTKMYVYCEDILKIEEYRI